MSILDEAPLYRRVREHACRRLLDGEYRSPESWMPDLRQFVRLEKEMLRRYHEKRDPGRKVCQAYAVMVDVLLECLLENAVKGWIRDRKKVPADLAIVANGGYGRAELCPHSDIDISILYSSQPRRQVFRDFQEWVTGHVLYPLWDLKFKVGHASRTIRESISEAKADMQTKTTLMQSRHVCGSEELTPTFEAK